MASTKRVEPVIRLCAVITRHAAARQWAIDRIGDRWGGTSIVSPEIPFEAGGYYTASMGSDLTKVLVATAGVCDPAELADWKHESNRWETEYAANFSHEEDRPLNLDAGYATQAKLVLATTKDRDHRIYLRDGMFAEVTLCYVGRKWQSHRWTYPSYRAEKVSEFVTGCRNQLRAHLKETRQFRNHETSRS